MTQAQAFDPIAFKQKMREEWSSRCQWMADRPRPAEADPSIPAAIPLPEGSSYPSVHAAAAAAAVDVLAHLFPDRAKAIGAVVGRQVARRVLERAAMRLEERR